MLNYRKSIIRDLVPQGTDRLLDVGCGPIFPNYAYADKAKAISCVDWNMVKVGETPANLDCISGNFVDLDLPRSSYDAIIAADVFEHIQIEHEPQFIEKCLSVLKPNGRLIVSVPHRGRFAWLDPYEVKPLRDRCLAKLGRFKGVHNGSCDIRKGHKHYRLEELVCHFPTLHVESVRYWGHFFDPLLAWAYALLGEGSQSPIVKWLERRTEGEVGRDYGVGSFNMAVVFVKPA